jgi:Leucine-rich repeat (LRR) protein
MTTESSIEHFRSLGAFVATTHRLHAPNTSVSDADSMLLADLPELRQLVLSRTAITDGSLPQIERLRDLELLDLSETSISDAIAPVLANLSRLHTLGLYGTRITDVTLVTIAKLNVLQMLNLSDNRQISDGGFQQLAQLPCLKSIEIHGTNISDDAINAFTIQCRDVLIVTDRGPVRGVA